MENIICDWQGRECLGCIHNIIKLPQQLCQPDIKELAHIHWRRPLRRLKRTALAAPALAAPALAAPAIAAPAMAAPALAAPVMAAPALAAPAVGLPALVARG
jgi:hypothetical protein